MFKHFKILLSLLLIFQTQAHSCPDLLDDSSDTDSCITSSDCYNDGAYLDKTNKKCCKNGVDNCSRCGSDFFKVHGTTLNECIDSTKPDCYWKDLTNRECYSSSITSCDDIGSDYYKVYNSNDKCQSTSDSNCVLKDIINKVCYSTYSTCTDLPGGNFYTNYASGDKCQNKDDSFYTTRTDDV